MKNFDSTDALLDWAMEREAEAERFYLELAKTMDRAWMKAVFEDFAREERGHKAKLKAIKEGRLLLPAQAKVQDLKLADYLVEVGSSSEDLPLSATLTVTAP